MRNIVQPQQLMAQKGQSAATDSQRRNAFLLDLAVAREEADIGKVARDNGITNPDYAGANKIKSPQPRPNDVLAAYNAGIPDNSI